MEGLNEITALAFLAGLVVGILLVLGISGIIISRALRNMDEDGIE